MREFIRVGDRVLVEWFKRKPLVSLPTIPPKYVAELRHAVGVVEHIRSDTPDGLGKIEISIRADDGEEIIVPPSAVKSILTRASNIW